MDWFYIVQVCLLCFVMLYIIILCFKSGIKYLGKKTKLSFDNNYAILTLTYNEKCYNFILDSGSTISALNSKYSTELDIAPLKAKGSVTGMNGGSEVANYGSCNLNFNNKVKQIVFVVRDFKDAFEPVESALMKPIAGVLGTDFMQDNQIILDFEADIIYVGKN